MRMGGWTTHESRDRGLSSMGLSSWRVVSGTTKQPCCAARKTPAGATAGFSSGMFWASGVSLSDTSEVMAAFRQRAKRAVNNRSCFRIRR